MSSDNPWQAFLPKALKGNNSSLSQLSTTSSVRGGGRLSLSSRAPIHNKYQAPLSSTSSSEQTPKSKKRSLQRTPKSSSKKDTPNKSSSKNTTPSDGLSQRKIDSYFSNTFKKLEKLKNSNCTVIDLGSDSSEDEIFVLGDCERLKHSVSRNLFPAESVVKSCLETNKKITLETDASVQNKENQDFTFQNTSSKSSNKGNIAEDVFEVPTTMKPNATKVLQLVENMPGSAKDVSITKNISQTSTVQMENGDNLSSNTLNLVKNGHNSIDKTAVPSSTFPGCSKSSKHLNRNAENLTLAEHPQGKNRCNRKGTTEDPNNSHLLKIDQHVVRKNTSASKEILSSQMPSTSTNASCHTHSKADNHLVPLSSVHDISSFTDNFTGVTECVSSLPSSGEMWHPSNPICSDLSSDDFDLEHVVKKKSEKNHSVRKNKQKRKILEDNKDKGAKIRKGAGKKNKAKVPKGHEREKSTYDPEIKISKKPVEAECIIVKSSINQNSIGNKRKPCSESKTLDAELDNGDVEFSNDLQENFQLSGGFFPEEEHSKRPQGHAFVIRTPSVEYDLSPYMDESYITEDQGNIDSETDASSLIADIDTIDQHCDDTFTKGVEAVTPNHGEHDETEILNDSIYSSSTIIAPKNNDEMSCYQHNLVGKSIPQSEWNKLHEQQNVHVGSHVDSNSCSIREQMNGRSSISLPKTDSEDSSHSFEVSDGALEKLLEENMPRSSSPQEAEEAPSEVEFCSQDAQKAHQPHVTPEKKTSFSSEKLSSSSSEIADFVQELNLNNNCSSSLVNTDKSSERVAEWISQIPDRSSVGEGSANNALSKSAHSHTLVKEKDDKIQQTNATSSYAGIHFHEQNNKVGLTSKVSQCNINCQIKIFIKNGSRNEKVITKVDKENCKKRNACHIDSELEFITTTASYNIEVKEEKGLVTEQDRSSNKKNGKCLSHERSDEYYNDEGESYDVKKRPVKLHLKLGQWGWNYVAIDCVPQKNRNDNFSSEGSSIFREDTPMLLCIQEVNITMCKCSRSINITCYIIKEEMTETNKKYIFRSRYRTSLQEHVHRWGNPENPLTFSTTAYSKLSTSEDMNSSSVPFSEKETIILSNTQQELGLTNNIRYNKDKSSEWSINRNGEKTINGKTWTNSIQNQMEKSKENGRKLKQGMVTDSQETSMSDVPYHEYTAATPSELSENFQEWMTPLKSEDLSKQTAADKWKDFMKVMQNGRRSSSISTDSNSVTQSLSPTSSKGGFFRGSWNQNKGSERRNCPFYKLIEGTKFAVDAFSYGTIPGITHYFLSHFHFDHYMGLNKKFSHPIYCSSVTAKLIALKIKVNPSLIRRLDPGQTVVVDGTKVTALDANHCPGSLMLLFQLPGNKRTHLHVGDFRAHPCMESYHALWNVDIDRLYLDTTYCDPTYTFPSQQEAIESILTIVEEAIQREPKTLIVCGTYNIGKERVFAAIAETIKAKIWAPAPKRQLLLCVKEGLQDLSASNDVDIEGGAGRELGIANALNHLTTVKEEAKIHVLSMKSLTVKYLEEHLESIKGMKFNNVIAFRPTGWAHGRSGKGKNATLVNSSSQVKIYEVAYSEHSSFLEMERFVKFVRPKTVIKTVNVGSEQQRNAMEKHINTWLSCVKTKRPLPSKCIDSPKTSYVTEEQKKIGVFQPKKSLLQMKSNVFHNPKTPFPLLGDASENSLDNMRTASLPTQMLSFRSQQNQIESGSLQITHRVKRMHPYNSEGHYKKYSS